MKGFEDLGIWQWEELVRGSQDWYLSRDKCFQFAFLGHLPIRVLILLVSKLFMAACSVQAQARALHGSLHLGGGGVEGRGYM